MKMLIQRVTCPETMLLILADKLASVNAVRKGPEAQYLAQQIMHVYATMAERFGLNDFAEQLRDEALRLLEPALYAQLAEERRTALGLPADEAIETYLDEVKARLSKEVFGENSLIFIDGAGEMRQVGISMSARKKSLSSGYFKTQEKMKYPRLADLPDLLGIEIVIHDASPHAIREAAGDIIGWLIKQEWYEKHEIKDQARNGFFAFQINAAIPFSHDNGESGFRRLQIHVLSFDDKMKTLSGNIAHWQYKMTGYYFKKNRQQFAEIKEEEIPTGDFSQDFMRVKSLLESSAYVLFIDSEHGEQVLVPLKLPAAAKPADIVAHELVDLLNRQYQGLHSLRPIETRVTTGKIHDAIRIDLSETEGLRGGEIIMVRRKGHRLTEDLIYVLMNHESKKVRTARAHAVLRDMVSSASSPAGNDSKGEFLALGYIDDIIPTVLTILNTHDDRLRVGPAVIDSLVRQIFKSLDSYEALGLTKETAQEVARAKRQIAFAAQEALFRAASVTSSPVGALVVNLLSSSPAQWLAIDKVRAIYEEALRTGAWSERKAWLAKINTFLQRNVSNGVMDVVARNFANFNFPYKLSGFILIDCAPVDDFGAVMVDLEYRQKEPMIVFTQQTFQQALQTKLVDYYVLLAVLTYSLGNTARAHEQAKQLLQGIHDNENYFDNLNTQQKMRIIKLGEEMMSDEQLPLSVSTRRMRPRAAVKLRGRSQRVIFVDTGSVTVRVPGDQSIVLRKGDIVTTYGATGITALEHSFVTIISEGRAQTIRAPPFDSCVLPNLLQRPAQAPAGVAPAEIMTDSHNRLCAVVYRGDQEYPSRMLPITIPSGAIGIGIKTARGKEDLHRESDHYMEVIMVLDGSAVATFTDAHWQNREVATIKAGQKVIIYPQVGHGFEYINAKVIVVMQGPYTGHPKIKPAASSPVRVKRSAVDDFLTSKTSEAMHDRRILRRLVPLVTAAEYEDTTIFLEDYPTVKKYIQAYLYHLQMKRSAQNRAETFESAYDRAEDHLYVGASVQEVTEEAYTILNEQNEEIRLSEREHTLQAIAVLLRITQDIIFEAYDAALDNNLLAAISQVSNNLGAIDIDNENTIIHTAGLLSSKDGFSLRPGQSVALTSVLLLSMRAHVRSRLLSSRHQWSSTQGVGSSPVSTGREDFHSSAIRKGELGEEVLLISGTFSQVTLWLSRSEYPRQSDTLATIFPTVYKCMQMRFPVLYPEISGALTFELYKDNASICMMDVYRRVLRIDIELLESAYLTGVVLEEELGHLARSLLDVRSGMKEGPRYDKAVIQDIERGDEYHEFWALEEFATDYQLAKRFGQDYEETQRKTPAALEHILAMQAEAMQLLIRWNVQHRNTSFIPVILRAITVEHKFLLDAQIKKSISEDVLAEEFRPFPTHNTDFDLIEVLYEYFVKMYSPDLAEILRLRVHRNGFNALMETIDDVLTYYRDLQGRFGRGIDHGLNKQKMLRRLALRDEKAFFDLLVIVVEENSIEETEKLVAEIRGTYIPFDTRVVVVKQPDANNPAQNLWTINGNYSSLINLIMNPTSFWSEVEDVHGSVCVILSAGTAKRNAPLTHSGFADKGKQACFNAEPYLCQVIKQVYHYWEPNLEGVIVTTNDGIKALGAKVVLGEYGIEMIGDAKVVDDPELDDLGTAFVEPRPVATYAKPIRKMFEKAAYALRKVNFGEPPNRAPVNWADYYFRWDAIRKMRRLYGSLRDENGLFLHLRYGLDTAGDLFEGVTSKDKPLYVRERMEKKKWQEAHAAAVWDVSRALMNDVSLGGAFAFVNAGNEALFVDTGSNAVYVRVARDLTLRLEDATTEEEKKKAVWAMRLRSLLDVPEPNAKGQLVCVPGGAYVEGRYYTAAELQESELFQSRVGRNVFVAGSYITIGHIEGSIGDQAVLINPLVNKLDAPERSCVFFVEEPEILRAVTDMLVCDVYHQNKKVRVCMSLEQTANDLIGKWDLVHNTGAVFVTAESAVAV
ncbi:MAG: hypothetical protein KBA46_05910, partial [Candidatus Omnitrophica bacterium]|nr:hypothetical protein [Candidatus Omnitrophota bacterium]